MNNKIEMYKALRTVKEKLDKGALTVLDDRGNVDLKEFAFFVNRVVLAIFNAETDPELQDIKHRYDQSKS